MESVAVDGAVLNATILGDPARPPVIMLHGLVTGNMASWYSPVALPLSANHHVMLYDQRGHGSSTMPQSGFDLDSQSRDLDCVLAHFQYATTPVDVVGYSMGALIALRFALRNPARVRRLVLVDAPMPAGIHVAPSLHALAAQPGSGAPPGRRGARQRARLQTLMSETTLLRDVSAMQAEPDAALGRFDKPVLLIYGRKSPCLRAGEHLRAVLPRAGLVLLDAAHDLPQDVPRDLLRHIGAFLAVPAPDIFETLLTAQALA